MSDPAISSAPRYSASARFSAGITAIILALVAASVAALVLRAPSPLEPVADTIMDRTPVSLAIPLLLRLGAIARPLALLGAVAVSMGVGGVLGVVYPLDARLPRGESLATADPAPLARFMIVLAGLALFVAVVFPTGNAVVAACEVVCYVLGLYLFRPPRPSPGRREFLLHNGRVLGGIGVLVGLLYVGPVVDRFRLHEAGRELFRWRPPRRRLPGFELAGLTPEVTPTRSFYTMDEDLEQPEVDVQSWSLQVDGLARRPLRLTFADLLDLPRRNVYVTQECVSNPVGGPLMSTALFSGVRLGDVLQRAGIADRASAVLCRAVDGHEEAIPLALALDPSVLLAYAVNGRLLAREHGFPLRLLVPGYYGFKGIKWLQRISLTTDARQGHWESNGWNALPAVNTMARIDLARRAAGGTLVAGIAFAGRRGVRAVQVRADGGPWHRAELHLPALSPFTWVQWRAVLPVQGRLHLECRAVDGTGRVQTATARTQKPDGATGYYHLDVTV